MTRQEAKKIPIPALLERLGILPDPARRPASGRDIWYRSPFRPGEREASFHVHRDKNIWFDFGEVPPVGGDVLDLVARLQNCDFPGVLDFLERIWGQNRPAPGVLKTPEPLEEDPGLVLETISRAFSPALMRYIETERCIPPGPVREHLRQVHFRNRAGQKFYAAGMQNRAGGWEIRNPYFKACIGRKDFTHIPGRSGAEVSIFEGMFDFLSAVAWYGPGALFEHDVLVLHSLSCQMFAIDWLKSRPETRNLKLYLDNDEAGQKAFDLFRSALPGHSAEPCFALYLSHKDFNEFLIAQRRQKNN